MYYYISRFHHNFSSLFFLSKKKGKAKKAMHHHHLAAGVAVPNGPAGGWSFSSSVVASNNNGGRGRRKASVRVQRRGRRRPTMTLGEGNHLNCRRESALGIATRKMRTTRFERGRGGRVNLWTEDDPPGPLSEEETREYGEENPGQFLLTSVTFYIVMAAASQTGCDYLNIHPDLFAQIFVFNPDMATIWSIPLLLSLAVVLLVDEKVEFVKEVKEIMVDGVIPNVAPTGANGILMLSLGAGIGEEALFRGFLMPFLSNGILERGLGGAEVATYASLGATSVIFGALHAITPAYQVWATAAGFLFGWEYLHDGLGSAMFTHCFYDFIAFAFIVLLWGKPSSSSSNLEEEEA